MHTPNGSAGAVVQCALHLGMYRTLAVGSFAAQVGVWLYVPLYSAPSIVCQLGQLPVKGYHMGCLAPKVFVSGVNVLHVHESAW